MSYVRSQVSKMKKMLKIVLIKNSCRDTDSETPSPTTGKYIVGVETTIAFDLSYTIPSGTVTPTAVKVYFSNADGNTKTTEVPATGTPTDAVNSDGTFSGLTAALTIDSTNCAAYTKLSASIEATGDTDNQNNVASVDFGSAADKAGIKVCADVGAGTFTLKTPNPATSGFPLATATASTFDLAYTVVGTGGTVSNVKVYFSDANGSKKSTEVTAGGSNAPSGDVDTAGTWEDLAASLTLDATNCEDYTKLCASITITDDDSSNNEVCIEFGKDAAKAGEKPDCTDTSVTTVQATTDSGTKGATTESGVVGLVQGMYSILVTLALSSVLINL
ncbi:autotransporter adhesin BpaC-like [Ptychodera flava]|uniref:autotransporter adhesin BpaC-like n=1 Tax=Ptychodera flava TaxID=63121 RepID=UPI00396A3EB0